MWERVVGQERAVEMLRRAATRPVHAYLLSGPPGSGIDEAARCFAAALLCDAAGCGVCDHCTRALRGRHPDVVDVEPDGTFLRVEQAAQVVEEAFRSPFEAERKVIVLHEAERLNEPAANKLLKTFEEPPERTLFLLLTSAPDELLETVRSRCQRVDFSALGPAVVRETLVAEGLAGPDADRVAALAGGRLDRARLLAGPYRPLRRAFAEAPRRLDGTGAAVAAVAADLAGAVEDALAELGRRHAAELEALEEEIERAGYPERPAQRLRKAMGDRHKRAEARARVDALLEGITALETAYRDALVTVDARRGGGGDVPELQPASCLEALEACAKARSALQGGIQLNRDLLLEHLLLSLPAAF